MRFAEKKTIRTLNSRRPSVGLVMTTKRLPSDPIMVMGRSNLSSARTKGPTSQFSADFVPFDGLMKGDHAFEFPHDAGASGSQPRRMKFSLC
jgi:hypothetical protein